MNPNLKGLFPMIRFVLLFLALSLVLTGCTVELLQEAEPDSSQEAMTASEPAADVDTPAEAILEPRLKPLRVLLIGSDFLSTNLGIDAFLAGIVNEADADMIIETEYLASDFATLVKHSTLDAPAKIREGNWDAVVLDELFSWANAEEFYVGVRALDEIIDETDAATVILVPWVMTDDPGIADERVEIYERIGAEVNATLVPVGQAWQRLLARDVDIPLLDDASDLIYRQSVPGTYLSAFVFYHSLYGGEPDYVPFLPVDVLPIPKEPSYSMEKMREKWTEALSEEDAALLQQIAWETVMAYETGQ